MALLRVGVAASSEHRSALSRLECSFVVDIGANKGQFSLFARHFFPVARIDAFEPLEGPAVVFRKLFINDPHVVLHAFAVGESSASATMHVSARDDSSSLLPIGSEQTRIFPGTQEAARETVEVRRLDDIIKSGDITAPALLKLDVQGYELPALRGCDALLDRFQYVYCECSFVPLYEGQALADAVIAWLHERGFVLKGVYNMAYETGGRAIQADFLFFRASSCV